MNCFFHAIEGGVRCKRCGQTLVTDHPPERCHAVCDGAGQCLRFGAELRRQDCPTCCGAVQLKIFACALHGECTAAKPLAEIACCATCADFSE